MRDLLRPYNKEDNLNYLCIAASLMGFTSLYDLLPFLTGFESIKSTLNVDSRTVVENLRLAGVAPLTAREMELYANTYIAYHDRRDIRRSRNKELPSESRFERRYRIKENLEFEARWSAVAPGDIDEASVILSSPLGIRVRTMLPAHDPNNSASVSHPSTKYEGRIEPLGFVPPDVEFHSITRPPNPPGFISWVELIAIADKFDQIDVQNGRQADGQRSWNRRLNDEKGNPTARLLIPSELGLVDADGIDLRGLKHFIGLPGSGKTTVLYLLAGYLAANGYKACFLFPSIEVATAFVEVLQKYDVDSALLYGQSDSTRTRHALKFASSLVNNNNGFGVTRPSAPLFSTNCALTAFASDEEEEFPHAPPPCLRLKQNNEGESRENYSCVLASVCGYQKAERELVSKSIWAGHILSLDRPVSKLFGLEDVSLLEYVSRHFDLIVLDEADDAQACLDQRGTPIMQLTGGRESLWSTLISELHLKAAAGQNAFVKGENLPVLLAMTGRFGIATERLISQVTHFEEPFQKRYANILLTIVSIISDIFPGKPDDDEEAYLEYYSKRQGVESVVDFAVKQIAFRQLLSVGDEEDDEDDQQGNDPLILAAKKMGVTDSSCHDFYSAFLSALELWERDANNEAISELAKALRKAPIDSPHDDRTLLQYSALLASVSMVVLQYFGLSPHLRLLQSEGLVREQVFVSRMQIDLERIVPDSLVGRLSGVRYVISEEGNISIAQVGFNGTPRTLPRLMASMIPEGDSAAVLLTSATSMLEPSPSYHIKAGPHYVLQRPNSGTGWQQSNYSFTPMREPSGERKFLRFSGAGMLQQENNLRAMVDQLLEGGDCSRVSAALLENDVVNGIPRKAAFIVNSYAQCDLIFEHIRANHPYWRSRIRYLRPATLDAVGVDNSVTAAEVELLADDPHWQLLVFPMGAIGRGVNIVFPHGPRANQAILGSMYFLTRPHPRTESLQLIQGLVASASEEFDLQSFENSHDALAKLKESRKETFEMAKHLMRIPLRAQSLGQYGRPFVADQMITILQTIGRAMRGDCPAYVYFVDAAWAPRSALDQFDDARTSMLVMMQAILRDCVNHTTPAIRECYENLYLPFLKPLTSIDGLNIKQ